MKSTNSDYDQRKAAMDAEYASALGAHLRSLSPEERKAFERAGITGPMVSYHGSGSPGGDIAESSLASHHPDIADLIDGNGGTAEPDRCSAADAVRHTIAYLQSKVVSLQIDCFAYVTNVSSYDGVTQADIAERHGVSRAAVSKICIEICEEFNLRPPPGMRSKKTRKACSRAQIRKNSTL